MGGRNGRGIRAESISSAEKDYINEMENSPDGVKYKTLSKLNDYDENAYSVHKKISTNFLIESQEFTKAEKVAFDRLTTKKSYELYRGDTRYNTENTQKGDILDFKKKATFVSSDIEHGIVAKSKSVIVFEKGTKSLRRKFDTAEHSELIRGEFVVTKIIGNKIYVKAKK